MQRFQTILPIAGALCLAAACSNQKSPTSTLNNPNHYPTGSANLEDLGVHLAYQAGQSTDDTTDEQTVCGHFTLQPYSPASDGTPQLAGSAVSFTSTAANANDAAAATDQILGCIDGPDDSLTPAYNWGYIVTATDFFYCDDSTQTAIPGLSPTTTTLNVPVECEAGIDVPLSIQVSVAIATPNQAGYIDISAGVTATDVQIGCKQADIPTTDNLLHFGESYISDDGSTATGLVGLGPSLITPFTGTPTQFGGSVNGVPATDVDTYFTGDINPSTVGTIYQTFVNPCTDGSTEYADTDHAQCVSDNSGTPTGTVAELADAFAMTSSGFAAVSVVSGGLTIYSSLTDTTMVASPFVAGYNTISTTNILSSDPSLANLTVTGVFIDQSTPLQFLVAANTVPGGTPEFATLSFNGTTWVLSAFAAPTAQTISCNGLYAAPASCFSPAACTEPLADCPQSTSEFSTELDRTKAAGYCQGVDSTLTYTLPETFCTDAAGNDDFVEELGNQYSKYIENYSECYQSCSGALGPASCAALGGPGCTVAYPNVSAYDSTACTVAPPQFGITPFPAGYCSSTAQQNALPAAYNAYVAAYAACNSGDCSELDSPNDTCSWDGTEYTCEAPDCPLNP